MNPDMPEGLKKIKHVVILMMENRSFDHYLGALSLPPENREDVAGLPWQLPSNPDLGDQLIPAREITAVTGETDPPHDWVSQHDNFHGGRNDGFVQSFQRYVQEHPATSGSQDRTTPMSFYTRRSLPVLYSLADQFTVCDHWFSSVLSSTWPNRKYLYSGLRDGDNDTQTLPPYPGFGTTPFLNSLEDARDPDTHERLTWKCYYSDLPFLGFWYRFAAFHAQHNFASVAAFVDDCREDRLPTVSFVDPPFSVADDHPAHDIRLGQKFIGLIVDALSHSESWDTTALVLLYDENGGFYDHVPPPSGFTDKPAETGEDVPFGFRVPAVIVSPYTRRGVSRTVYDHTSVMSSIAARWGVDFPTDAFGTRWKRAPTIWSCFDFNQVPEHRQYTSEAFADLSWAVGAADLLAKPLGGVEDLLERTFVLPTLKTLDGRAQVYNVLTGLERGVAGLKQVNLGTIPP